MGILPGGVKAAWDDNDWWTQLCILAFDQIRQIEEFEIIEATIGARHA